MPPMTRTPLDYSEIESRYEPDCRAVKINEELFQRHLAEEHSLLVETIEKLIEQYEAYDCAASVRTGTSPQTTSLVT